MVACSVSTVTEEGSVPRLTPCVAPLALSAFLIASKRLSTCPEVRSGRGVRAEVTRPGSAPEGR